MPGEERTETVLALLRGELSAEEAAARHDVDVAEIEKWEKDFLEAGKHALGAARDRAPAAVARGGAAASRRKAGPVVAIALGAAVLVAGGLGIWRWVANRPSETARACSASLAAELRKLREPMRVVLYATPGLPKVDEAAAHLERLLRGLAEASGGRLEVERSDAKDGRARESGLQEAVFGSGDGESAVLSRGYFGLAFTYGSERETIPMLSPESMDGVEFWIGNKLRELRARVEDTHQSIAILASPGGIGPRAPDLIAGQAGRPGPNLVGIVEQAMPFYRLKDVEPGQPPADEARVMLVTQPGEPIGEAARRAIDTFLMRGDRALIVFAGAAAPARGDPLMRVRLDLRGVDALLEPYGIEIRRDVILDADADVSVSMPVVKGDGASHQMAWPALLRAVHDTSASAETQRLDQTFAGFFRLAEVAVPFASTLVAHPERQSGARFRVVARSSAASVVAEGPELSLAAGEAPATSGPPGQRAIAIAVEGQLKSAFGDARAAARIFVVSSTTFLANPFARAGASPDGAAFGGDEAMQTLATPYAQKYLTATILAFKNALDWATADDGLLACSAVLLEPRK